MIWKICRSDMGKEDKYRGMYDPVATMQNVPALLGMELVKHGQGLQGGYYLNGDRHAYRRDKLKVFISRGCIWVSEEGGRCVSLPQWLIEFGGASDFKDALRIINGKPQAIEWNRESREKVAPKVQYVSPDVLEGAKQYPLEICPLFRWMARLLGEDKVRKVWNAYNVTATSKGGACFWYLNPSGQICHDKIVFYGEDGHRIKTLPMGRKYRIGDGYTENPMFGSHFKNKPKGILESEKSALMASCYYGGVWLATGGKGNLRDPGGIPLYADRDAEEIWSAKGDCVDWYSDWPECGEHSDLGDKIEWLCASGR